MNTLVLEPRAKNVRFEADTMWIDLADGSQLSVPLAYFPRLLSATPSEREKFIISGGGPGLHWSDLDEDISARALILGIGHRTKGAA